MQHHCYSFSVLKGINTNILRVSLDISSREHACCTLMICDEEEGELKHEALIYQKWFSYSYLSSTSAVDCWDGPDGEPMVQHGYTLTSKITLKSVIETINKYAFINNQ